VTRPKRPSVGTQPGEHLGGIRTVADLLGRCVLPRGVRADDPDALAAACWHIRNARGGQMDRDKLRVWVHGRGSMALGSAVWLLSRGEPVPPGYRAALTCASGDCANPAHRRLMLPGDVVRAQFETGRMDTPRRRAALLQAGRAMRKLTDEQRAEIARTPEISGAEWARRLGVTQSRINAIRAEMRARLPLQTTGVPSVFALGRMFKSGREGPERSA
jgi:hypothetical protein